MSMLMVSSIFVILCVFLVEIVCVGFALSIYICIDLGYKMIKRGNVWIQLTGLISPKPVPSKNPDFQCHISWSFLCSMVCGVGWQFVLLILVGLVTIILFNKCLKISKVYSEDVNEDGQTTHWQNDKQWSTKHYSENERLNTFTELIHQNNNKSITKISLKYVSNQRIFQSLTSLIVNSWEIWAPPLLETLVWPHHFSKRGCLGQ